MAILLAFGVSATARAQGVFLTSIGPVNQSMGGAATAAPIDAPGALNWNPGSISGLRSSELAFGFGLVLPTAHVSSRFDALGLAGSTGSESGVTAIPTVGLVARPTGSPLTFGLGVFGIGGFSANYRGSALNSSANPILTPQPPFGGIGVGRVFSKAEICQIVPTLSYALTDKFSFGVSPIVNLAWLAADPLVLAPPSINGIYGPGTGTRTAWGGGFQVGAYYITDVHWHFGVSYKSPQWFEPFRYHSENEVGEPTFAKVNFQLPSIVSLGTAYSGFECWLFALDVRYYDYRNADGFRQSGFNPDGSVAGLGWKSVMSVSEGVQFEATERLKLRTGYTFGQNPVSDGQSMFNIASALIIQHWLSTGATYQFGRNIAGTIAYTHGFENQVTGPFQTPFGPIPGTSVTNRISSDILSIGATVTF